MSSSVRLETFMDVHTKEHNYYITKSKHDKPWDNWFKSDKQKNRQTAFHPYVVINIDFTGRLDTGDMMPANSEPKTWKVYMQCYWYRA